MDEVVRKPTTLGLPSIRPMNTAPYSRSCGLCMWGRGSRAFPEVDDEAFGSRDYYGASS